MRRIVLALLLSFVGVIFIIPLSYGNNPFRDTARRKGIVVVLALAYAV